MTSWSIFAYVLSTLWLSVLQLNLHYFREVHYLPSTSPRFSEIIKSVVVKVMVVLCNRRPAIFCSYWSKNYLRTLRNCRCRQFPPRLAYSNQIKHNIVVVGAKEVSRPPSFIFFRKSICSYLSQVQKTPLWSKLLASYAKPRWDGEVSRVCQWMLLGVGLISCQVEQVNFRQVRRW